MRVKGFTIPELVLVMGLIGVLASISFVLLNPLQSLKRSRDAVRFHDLNTLKSALVLTLQNGATFGNRCTRTSPCDSLSGTSAVDGSGYIDLDLTGFLNVLPRDPLASSGTLTDLLSQNAPASYQFAHDDTGNFEIRAHLESKDNASRYTDEGGNNSNYYEVGTKLDIL